MYILETWIYLTWGVIVWHKEQLLEKFLRSSQMHGTLEDFSLLGFPYFLYPLPLHFFAFRAGPALITMVFTSSVSSMPCNLYPASARLGTLRTWWAWAGSSVPVPILQPESSWWGQTSCSVLTIISWTHRSGTVWVYWWEVARTEVKKKLPTEYYVSMVSWDPICVQNIKIYKITLEDFSPLG